MSVIFEPFRIKSLEPIRITDRSYRKEILKKAHYNLFAIHSEDVMIDLLTDSGTSSMSSNQWAALMTGDEAYACSPSFFRFESAVKELTGFKHILPVHQGRAAERILFGAAVKSVDTVPNNSHFDTTRANVEAQSAEAVDLLIEEGKNPTIIYDFKGNMDLGALEAMLDSKNGENIPLCVLTVTNNTAGGQPVSMENIRNTSELVRSRGIPLYLDACRFAENAYFIKLREKGYENKTVFEIAQEMFSYADGCTMSAKKDGLVNIGGWVASNDDVLVAEMRNQLILTEGFPTYGGLAGRDLEALAVGLKEVVQEDYLQYRIASTKYLADGLEEVGLPVIQPAGGHAVYIDALRALPHLSREQLPGQTLAAALYEVAGVRGCEIGTVMFGHGDKLDPKEFPEMDLVRLALPRRVYTQSHVDYIIEKAAELVLERDSFRGTQLVSAPHALRHFTAQFEQK